MLGAGDLHAPVGQDRGRVGNVLRQDRVVVVDQAPGRDELVGQGRGRAHHRRRHRHVDHGETVLLQHLGRLAERQAVEGIRGSRERALRLLVAGLGQGKLEAQVPQVDPHRLGARHPGRRLGSEDLRPHHDPVPLSLRDRDRAHLAVRAPIDADADGQGDVEREVAGSTAPGALAQPGVLEAHELVEVVAAPLQERAAGPEARELPPEILTVLEPRGGIAGKPDGGVLDIRVARGAVPVDEGAVDSVAVDEQRAPDLELAGA